MKKLVIYYSLTGNVKYIAGKMAAAVGADLLEVKPKQDINPKGFMKYFWGGKMALSKKNPEIFPLDKNPNDYDLIIVGTPVWGWTFAPALRTLFTEHKFTNKKVALFCCHGGGKGDVFAKMKQAIGNNNYIGEIDFKEPQKNNPEEMAKQAIKWAEEL